jgi:hypothetical protein
MRFLSVLTAGRWVALPGLSEPTPTVGGHRCTARTGLGRVACSPGSPELDDAFDTPIVPGLRVYRKRRLQLSTLVYLRRQAGFSGLKPELRRSSTATEVAWVPRAKASKLLIVGVAVGATSSYWCGSVLKGSAKGE